MSFVGGSLSLKGDSKGVKKKKKSRDGKKTKPEQDTAAAPALADEVSGRAEDAIEQPPPGHKTKAQLQHEEYVAKREAEVLKKAGVKSHRQRISEYNEKLSLMTEHNDIPKAENTTQRQSAQHAYASYNLQPAYKGAARMLSLVNHPWGYLQPQPSSTRASAYVLVRDHVCIWRSISARAASPATEKRERRAADKQGDGPGTRLRTLDDLPYERGLPFLGIGLELVKPDIVMADIFERNNDDVFVMHMGPGRERVAAFQDVERMQEVSVTQGRTMFPKWPEGVENIILAEGVSKTNEEIQPWRMAISKILSKGTIMQLQLPLMVQEFTDTIRRCTALEEEFQFFEVSKRVTYSAAVRAAMGDILSKEELDDMFPLSVQAGKGVFDLNFGLEDGLPLTTYWRSKRAHKQLQDILSARIADVLQDREQLQSEDCMVRKVLEALEEEGVETASKEGMDITVRLAREVIMLMFVGTDTTSHSISNTMMFLAKHPQWITALAEEQKRLMAEHGEELDRKVFSRSAVALAIAQETLRISPPIVFLFRQTLEDVVIKDIICPKGTEIAMCPRKAILETGNGTKTFDPGFWLSDDLTECTPNDEMGNFVFGQGARNCVGKNLAVIELVAFLAVLGREVSAVKMPQEEMDRVFTIVGGHPTGLPLQLLPHSSNQ